MPVPYTFASQTGILPLNELDENFEYLENLVPPLALSAGTVLTAAQPNITSVGTLSSLSCTGTVAAGTITASILNGTLASGPQYNITALGVLSNLTVNNDIVAASLIGTQITGVNINGNIATPNQPGITTIGTLTSLSVTGNTVSGNLLTSGIVSATGNLIGDGLVASLISGQLVTAAQTNITSLGTLTSLNVTGNITGGNLRTGGLITATGNVTGGNLLTGGLISATSTITSAANVIGANFSTAGLITATGNVTGGNLITAGLVTATGNITGGNVITAGVVSAAGNVTGNYILGNAAFVTGLPVSYGNADVAAYLPTYTGSLAGALVSVTGNVTGGNIVTTGNVVGNVAGFSIGYRDLPQIALSGNTTLASTAGGKHYYSTSASNISLTVPTNVSVPLDVGTVVMVVNRGTATITITPAVGVSLFQAGNSTSANRDLTSYGMASLVKVDTNIWFVNGTGLA